MLHLYLGGHNGILGLKRASCGAHCLKLKRNVGEPKQPEAEGEQTGAEREQMRAEGEQTGADRSRERAISFRVCSGSSPGQL